MTPQEPPAPDLLRHLAQPFEAGAIVGVWERSRPASGLAYRRHAAQVAALARQRARPLGISAAQSMSNLLAELATVEDALAAATDRVARPLHLEGAHDPAIVADLAEQILRGPATVPAWWTAPDPDTLVALADALRRRLDADEIDRSEVVDRWGPAWRTLADDGVAEVLDAAADATTMVLPLTPAATRGDVEILLGFADRTSDILERADASTRRASGLLGADLTTRSMSDLRDLLGVVDQLVQATTLWDRWATPAATRAADTVLDRLGDDLLSAATSRRAVHGRYTEEVWTADVDPIRGDPLRTLSRLTVDGRPPADPTGDARHLTEIQRVRSRVSSLHPMASAVLGPVWAGEETDVVGARHSVALLVRVHELLGEHVDHDALQVFLGPGVLRGDGGRRPLAEVVGTLAAWRLDAARLGHTDVDELSIRDLQRWIDDARRRLGRLARAWDGAAVLGHRADLTVAELSAAAARARVLQQDGGRIESDGFDRLAVLGLTEDDHQDLRDVHDRIRWVAHVRAAWRGLPLPDPAARVLAARAVPDPADIRHHIADARSIVERIIGVLDR